MWGSTPLTWSGTLMTQILQIFTDQSMKKICANQSYQRHQCAKNTLNFEL